MKSFKQFDESHTGVLNSAEDDNLHLVNVQDERVLQRLNAYVGAIAQQEYMQPDAAMKQLNNKLNIVGLNFVEPKIGISHQKDGGLKIEFNWEKQENNQYKVFASLK